jgi:hypothetical protein
MKMVRRVTCGEAQAIPLKEKEMMTLLTRMVVMFMKIV